MVAAIDPAHGRVAADSPAALKQAGNEALKTDLARAAHMYTLGIDLCLKGADIDELTSADWYRLDGESNGALHALLANRSFAYLQQTDPAAAVVDAEYCCLARPEFAKGHMRLLAALEANGATASERRAACARGIRACPASAALKDEWSRLGEKGDPAQTETEAAAAEAEAGLALTRRVAADPEDPRRFMAAGDLGSALAVGAHGLSKDVVEAERFLRQGASGGDVASQRHLGLLLLELGRPAEAAEVLRQAAAQGDEEAAATLTQLGQEATSKAEEARMKLAHLASEGDPRARAMLERLSAEGLAF
eukprot:Transcript_30241.p1 GENE.Transcript_30241~~Transcript_30241.p1  ORF type:complete len:307 (+),score=108.38 Transcript_30241:251-1171(+)